MNVRFEQIVHAPEDEIVELYKAGGWWSESPAARLAIPLMLKGSFCVMGAFNESNQLIGMGRAISDGCSDAYIQDVVVLKECRGLGIGAEIIKRLSEHCLEKQISWIGLISEPGVEAFYERLGFKVMKDYQPMLFSR